MFCGVVFSVTYLVTCLAVALLWSKIDSLHSTRVREAERLLYCASTSASRPDCIGISYYLIPAIANKRRINALSVRLVGFISSHQLTDRKPLVWPLSVVFRCLPTDRIYFCLDNRVLCVGITLLFAPSASISHSPDRRSYRQS